ncbi:ATPase [Aureococcus anophagefferens]|nr:ATPase [Aureococcus anophagefferens]
MCKPDMDKQLKPDNKPDMELSVHFRNLSVRFKDVVALAPCSGDVPAGELTALMGPTGCGKTSLLNAISGAPRERRQRLDDLVFPGLTIRETLVFSARLRLADATLAEKLRQVEECIELLRLSHCADAMVGGGMDRGVSGGERKRLMVGQEMLTNPRLLCCDEPTLGFVPTAEIMLRKELSVNSFRLEAWYLIQTTYLLLPMFAQSMIYLIVFFALSGVSTNPLVFVALYAVVVIALLTFQSIGLLLSAAVKPENLSTCAMLFVTYCFLFTGFFIRLDETAVPWAAFCNPVFYILHLAVWSVFSIDNKRFKCGNDTDDEGTIYVDSCGGGADRNDGKIAVVEIYKQYELRRFEPAIAPSLSYEEGKGADAEKPPLNARKSVLSRAEPEAVLLADDAEAKESA